MRDAIRLRAIDRATKAIYSSAWCCNTEAECRQLAQRAFDAVAQAAHEPKKEEKDER